MEIVFNINYHTVWGQRLLITGACTALGDGALHAAKEMHFIGEGVWRLAVTLPDTLKELKYKYIIEHADGSRTSEDQRLTHHLLFDPDVHTYELYDHWQLMPDRMFYTSAFTKNIFARRDPEGMGDDTHLPADAGDWQLLRFQLAAPAIKPGQTVAITGNQPCLGNWDPARAQPLSDAGFPTWTFEANAAEITFPLIYKYIAIDRDTNELGYWETGENRLIHPPLKKDSSLLATDFPLRAPETHWKGCGTVIPVFSLRSDDSFGIGDIGDLKKLIDWCRNTGQHVIQVLPMNDTTRSHTWKDSYPYSAISIYALHPLYLNIPMMGRLHDPQREAYYRDLQETLNAPEALDYETVEKHKTAYYREYFEQEKENIFKKADFNAFIAQNSSWLVPYAAFSYLRDKNKTAVFEEWGEFARYDRGKLEAFGQPTHEAYDEMMYLFFIQYTLHQQFETISTYARTNHVVLKGDIPIGVNRESVETWTEPGYFNMKAQSGAPPDDFSETGQNWSFPTYNWETMEKDGFTWWKKRFRNLNQFFDCIRIDHILGFFRIWEIPSDTIDGLCGHFRPALPLSVEAIEAYGLTFDKRWTKPRIHVQFLAEIFGENAPDNLYNHLVYCDSEHLILNDTCSTQRKIAMLFHAYDDPKTRQSRNGLMHIANEMLFLEDPYQPNCYHPRICAYKSYVYRELSPENREAFDRLYYDFYFRRHNAFWKKTALNRLTPLIDSTDMLVCGEDLGMIPASVHEVMSQLQICSLELERMSKVADREFSDVYTLPYYSVCTTSTHDMTPLRAWWKEDRGKTQRYYNHILRREGEAPEDCTPEIAGQIIRNHLQGSSMLTILPLQDWLATDKQLQHPDACAERINTPSDPDNNWCYRMHITLETLLHAVGFNQKIADMITESKR